MVADISINIIALEIKELCPISQSLSKAFYSPIRTIYVRFDDPRATVLPCKLKYFVLIPIL